MKRIYTLLFAAILILHTGLLSFAMPDPTVTVKLDEQIIHPENYGIEFVSAHVKDGRTMVPIRFLCEALGATITWQDTTKSMEITRADTTVVMAIGNDTAYLNNDAITMDVAPYIKDGRTFIPARYISEFFNQTVKWDGKAYCVDISQDKSIAMDSNLENWSLPMAAMLNYLNSGDTANIRAYRNGPTHYGGSERWVLVSEDDIVSYASKVRALLQTSWQVDNREALIFTIKRMTDKGHHQSFTSLAEQIENHSSPNNQVDKKRIDTTTYISKKWGERGILCWDAFRVANLAQWGYAAGYLTYAESLTLSAPAAKTVKENFTSWQEAYENYLDGYYWWANDYDLQSDIWQSKRGQLFSEMRSDTEISAIFNDELFNAGIKELETK